ncbi:MAG: glycosyltransferase [Thermoanaerobaculales bacterium]
MRVLLTASRFPLPPWRGNQARTLEWLNALSGDGHQVLLLCPRPDRRGALHEITVEVRHYQPSVGSGVARALAGRRPIQEGLYEGAGARRVVADAVREWNPDLAVVQMVRCGWAADVVTSSAPSPPVLFDAIDAMGLHFERASSSMPWPLRAVYRIEAARCRRRERFLVEGARITAAVAGRDLDALGVPHRRGRVIPVAGREPASVADLDGGPTVLLSGNLGYRPTVRGALWFARRVWPELLRRVPGARWVLAGARPAGAVRRLAEMPGVEVHADVADLAPFLLAARVAIAPMSSGSGVPMKVLEAMAAGVPVVADPWAAAGLEEPAAVAAAERPEEWVDELALLLEKRDAARLAAQRGHDLWRRIYHPERVAESICSAIRDASDN